MTGVSRLTTATGAIRLQMLHEAVPQATVMGLLLNPTSPNAEPDTREAQEAARKLGLELHVLGARNAGEIDTAFLVFMGALAG
jgi:putative ABC transport system substrate-binding protein